MIESGSLFSRYNWAYFTKRKREKTPFFLRYRLVITLSLDFT